MKLFSDCFIKCETCYANFFTRMCIAGHGDNDYSKMTKKRAIKLLEESKDGKYKNLKIDALEKYLQDMK